MGWVNYIVVRLTHAMQNKESIATSRLVSVGCWIEPSDGHTKKVSFNDINDGCVNVTHSDLRQLAFLPRLEDVCFYGVPVDALLTFAKSDRQFSIRHTRISRSGLDRLAHVDPNASNVG